jgi:hypothetical protein
MELTAIARRMIVDGEFYRKKIELFVLCIYNLRVCLFVFNN